MPLRDHFHPPLSRKYSWEVLHGQWPAVIVQQLRSKLPPGYTAGPTVHHGAQIGVDVAAWKQVVDSEPGSGGVATATWIAPPDIRVTTDLDDLDVYEVSIYTTEYDQQRLVAAIEIVSPANKDRPERRNAFIAKCAALLQAGVAINIVDVVTERHFNLYAELMEFIGHPLAEATPRSAVYAASCRWVRSQADTFLETWSYTLTVGQPLPQLPLWLAEALVVPLDLEQSYEQACHDLWIA